MRLRTRDKVVLAIAAGVCSFWLALLIHLTYQLAHWAFA